jgi:hypothetical protein
VDETQLDAILDNADFFSTFLDEIASSRILGQIDVNAAKARKTLKQQIYIGAITCFETYLSDAFINTVLSKDEYIRAFFSSFKDFKSQKFGVDELFTYVDRYEEIAKKAMMDVIYHNLPKVSHMYKEALDISFPDFSGIQSDIATRHDLVHRNGKTKEGKAIVVDQLLVDQVILRVESFVKEIDQQLKAKEAVA